MCPSWCNLCRHAVVRVLFEAAKNGSTPLHEATEHGHTPVVMYLLRQGANIMAKDGVSDDESVRLLIDALKVLMGMATGGWICVLRRESSASRFCVHRLWCVSACETVQCGATPLHRAARHGHESLVSCLVDQGADVAVATSVSDVETVWLLGGCASCRRTGSEDARC